jgi:hypothetical protein
MFCSLALLTNLFLLSVQWMNVWEIEVMRIAEVFRLLSCYLISFSVRFPRSACPRGLCGCGNRRHCRIDGGPKTILQTEGTG